jgi:hypothetical protein
MKSPALLVIPVLASLCLSGCATINDSVGNAWHNLQPHRLWRMNRHPAPRRDVYYSVSDPIPGLTDETLHEAESSAVQTR